MCNSAAGSARDDAGAPAYECGSTCSHTLHQLLHDPRTDCPCIYWADAPAGERSRVVPDFKGLPPVNGMMKLGRIS